MGILDRLFGTRRERVTSLGIAQTASPPQGVEVERLLSQARDRLGHGDYASALLACADSLRLTRESTRGAANATALFSVAHLKLLQAIQEEYRKTDHISATKLSSLKSGDRDEAGARQLAQALIMLKRWDAAVKKYEEVTGGQFGGGSGRAQLRDADIRGGILLAKSWLSIVTGRGVPGELWLELGDQSRRLLDEGIALHERAVERLCIAVMPGQWEQQLRALADEFAGEAFGKFASAAARGPQAAFDAIEVAGAMARSLTSAIF